MEKRGVIEPGRTPVEQPREGEKRAGDLEDHVVTRARIAAKEAIKTQE